MRLIVLASILSAALPVTVFAQDRAQTLADIRQELSVLYVELQGLKTELSTTGGVAGLAPSATVLDRVNVIESELQRLTAKSEELEFRIDRIVTDGTNRIGDLEFRLCELEEGCDIGSLGDTPTLGGGKLPEAPATALPADNGSGAQLAMGEQADFDKAKEELDAGSFRTAADLFAAFAETYPAGPLTAPALFHRGDALIELGEVAPAARAYLNSFSADPAGTQAPLALLRLGQTLGQLGQTNEACVTLGEVPVRFPDSEAAAEAVATLGTLGCS